MKNDKEEEINQQVKMIEHLNKECRQDKDKIAKLKKLRNETQALKRLEKQVQIIDHEIDKIRKIYKLKEKKCLRYQSMKIQSQC